MNINIFCVRHGKTEYNEKSLITGQKDPPLNEEGVDQAVDLFKTLNRSDFKYFVSSTLKRASETRDIYIREIGMEGEFVAMSDSRLNEVSLGSLEGKKRCTLKEFKNGNIDYKCHGGESYREASRRVGSFLSEIPTFMNEGNIIIFCHTGILRIMKSYFDSNIKTGKDIFCINIGNACFFALESKEVVFSDIWRGNF